MGCTALFPVKPVLFMLLCLPSRRLHAFGSISGPWNATLESTVLSAKVPALIRCPATVLQLHLAAPLVKQSHCCTA